MPLLLYPVFFGLIILGMKKNKRKDSLIYTLILAVYCLSGLVSCYIYFKGIYKGVSRITPLAVVYHLAMLILLIRPFRHYTRDKFGKIPEMDQGVVTTLTYLFIFLSIVSYVDIIPRINVRMLLYSTYDLRSLLYEHHKGYISYFGVLYWTVPLVLSFYYMVYRPQKKFLIFLLLVCSLTKVLSSFTVGGREYVLKYIVVLLVLAYLLYPRLSPEWKRSTVRFSTIFISLFVFVFISITIARFSNNDLSNTTSGDSVLTYFGQGLINFSRDFSWFPHGVPWGGHKFPILFGYGGGGDVVVDNNTGFALNNFSTCVGSFVKEDGILFATIITIVFSLLFALIGRIKANIFSFIYLTWAVEFIVSSLFFFNDTINGARFVSLMGFVIIDVFIRNIRK